MLYYGTIDPFQQLCHLNLIIYLDLKFKNDVIAPMHM